jgi:deoxycytidylate deaminase/dephospho-CoA kinase
VQAASNPLPIIGASGLSERDSNQVILAESANELFFAVVGHAGSGTTEVAIHLQEILTKQTLLGIGYQTKILKARDVIEKWARDKGKAVPPRRDLPHLKDVETLQDYGDDMRAAVTANGGQDHASVARALMRQIQGTRAELMGVTFEKGKPVVPDGKPKAYILDSLRHPAEVQLLRRIYGSAFMLVGVVCEEEKRTQRIMAKYLGAGRADAIAFMGRDAKATEKHGQQVADAFHLADYFIDNTADRKRKDESSNPAWVVVDNLSRLVKIITHTDVVRPSIEETAMHHAYSAKMRSACLSRQVGAALVNGDGNIVSTGTNEVPKAGGGVYGESFEFELSAERLTDSRCAMFRDPNQRFCRNTREQNKIIDELLGEIPELNVLGEIRKLELRGELRRKRIGGLLEFSRAVHAEMDALLSAAREGIPVVGSRLFVTTYPCHYCARHIVSAGIDEVQYIEPYPKSQALGLHSDAIVTEHDGWNPPSRDKGSDKKVLFRPFSGVAPRLYRRAYFKDRDLKDDSTGDMSIKSPTWGSAWDQSRISYAEMEARFSQENAQDGK